MLIVLLAVLAVVVYYLEREPSGWCSEHEVGCGLGSNFIAALTAALAAYLSFYRLFTEPRLVWPILHSARTKPTKLFSWLVEPRDYENPIGRSGFVRGLMDEVVDTKSPRIIVGDGGAGKTTVLVALATEAEDRGYIPLPLTFLGRDPANELDFARMAQEAFMSRARERALPAAAAEKAWSKLGGRVLVLVDDLDKANDLHEALRRAFANARDGHLMLIVASRAEGVPPALEDYVVELTPLRDPDAVEEILGCAQACVAEQRPSQQEVESLVRHADVTSTPYFLRVAMQLASKGRLPRRFPPSRAGARLALLDALHADYNAPGERAEWLSPTDRAGVLEDLEHLACRTLLDGGGGLDVVGIRNHERLADGGNRMGIVRPRQATELRFNQQVLQAYFASRLLRQPKATKLRNELLSANAGSPYLAMALVFAAASTDTGTGENGASVNCAATICDALLQHAERLGRSDALVHQTACVHLITAAVEAAALAGPLREPLGARAAAMVTCMQRPMQRNDAAARRLKMRLISELARLGGVDAVNALWTLEMRDPDYSVRWHAIAGITSAGEQRFAAVDTIATEAIANVKSIPRDAGKIDDNGPDPHGATMSRLKPLAWMLPALHSDAVREGRRPEARRLEEHMSEIATASDRSDQHGVLASLAQGFKHDAVRYARDTEHHAPALVHERLFDLLHHAPFWYTKIVLLHAISLRLIGARVGRPDSDKASESGNDPIPAESYLGPGLANVEAEHRLSAFLEQDTLHPFVKQAGALCTHALVDVSDRSHWESYIWTDEVELIARPPKNIDPQALHLVADITLLLNLNEQERTRHERARFGELDRLPACLNGPDRRFVLSGDEHAEQCPLGECPLATEVDVRPLCPDRAPRWMADDAGGETRPSRRLLNRSFCWHLRHTPAPPHWDNDSAAKLQTFWLEMERRAPT